MNKVINSQVKILGGVPTLFVNNKPQYGNIYISYFPKGAYYKDFSDAGIDMYSFPVYVASRGINSYSGIGPFRDGIWEQPGHIIFEIIDMEIDKILSANPKALLLPRICVELPQWWDNEHPDELNVLSTGEKLRASFSSVKWRDTAGEILAKIVEHINSSKYAGHVFGYHIAAGNTEEWYYHGSPKADYSNPAKTQYRKWLIKKYEKSLNKIRSAYNDPEFLFESAEIPGFDDGKDISTVILDPQKEQKIIDFREFLSYAVTDAILYFTRLLKKLVNNRIVVGLFYGYVMELTDPRFGGHDLQKLLNDRSIDFFCSPNSYMNRNGGVDWPSMTLTDSLKQHGKLYWAECDTRTFLTQPLKETKPSICPPGLYEGGIWSGPETLELTLSFLRKNFGKNITSGVGQWWFDMWGGWFFHPEIMNQFKLFSKIGQESLKNPRRESIAEIAIIVDEKANKYVIPETGILQELLYNQRQGLGNMGAPYDIFEISDLQYISAERYKLIVFLNSFCYSPKLIEQIKMLACDQRTLCWIYAPGIIKNGISLTGAIEMTGIQLEFNNENIHTRNPLLQVIDPDVENLEFNEETKYCTLAAKKLPGWKSVFSSFPNLSSCQLRKIANNAGVHIYTETGDVIYANYNYLCIHASSDGEKKINLPDRAKVIDAISGEEISKDCCSFKVDMGLFDTRLFKLQYVEAD